MDKTLSDALAVAALHGLTDRELASVVEAATVARREAEAQPSMVAMRHPSLPKVSVNVPPDAVEVYERSGWQLAPDAPSDDEAAEDAAPKPAKAAKAAAKKET